MMRHFSKFSRLTSTVTGHPIAFVLAVSAILIWAMCGPICHYSNTWQLVINTGTTIITFLMVFVIQHNQNRDAVAIQLKLNELIQTMEGARNALINAEDKELEELEELKKAYSEVVQESSN